jgi:medium-chain acyl-[acyl-carrier-protein] hydrolase
MLHTTGTAWSNSPPMAAGSRSKRPDPWIVCPRPNPQAQLRLFCFPYAGGGASIFHAWGANLPQEIEVCPVQLPGRENRLREPPYSWLPRLAQKLVGVLSPYLDRPFAFFGHSMGALISFELARQLRRQGLRGPVHLLVSAHRAPCGPYPLPALSQLPTPTLIEELRHLGGTPDEILSDTQMMQFLLPVLRADFAICETYTYTDDAPLNCALSAFGGLQDCHVSKEDLAEWREQTNGPFALQMLPGGHFFLHSAREPLLRAMGENLMDTIARCQREDV